MQPGAVLSGSSSRVVSILKIFTRFLCRCTGIRGCGGGLNHIEDVNSKKGKRCERERTASPSEPDCGVTRTASQWQCVPVCRTHRQLRAAPPLLVAALGTGCDSHTPETLVPHSFPLFADPFQCRVRSAL
eukprot:scaffold1864_cov106-Isochrysis_galbana.AAC.1